MRICPECRESYEDDAKKCPACEVALVATLETASTPASQHRSSAERADDASDFAVVLQAPTAFALGLPKSILDSNGIESLIEAEAVSSVYGGLLDLELTRGGPKLLVPRSELERAKVLLCEYQVQCEVPQGAVDRVVNRLVRPSLGGSSDVDDERLLELLQSQTKDFRVAVFLRTASLDDGRRFLERLLVAALKGKDVDEDVRRDVATVLSPHGSGRIPAAVDDAFAAAPTPEARTRLARTLGRFGDRRSAQWLVRLLEDEERSVRDEALEALFFRSGGKNFDYDPDADSRARAVAVERWSRWTRTLED